MDLLKGVVTGVNAFARTVNGTAVTGASFTASYYGAVPAINDVVIIAETAPGSWVVLTGPLQAAGMFGIGGDGDFTLTATSTFTAARTTSADATASGTTKQTLTSASANFTSSDIGSLITGTGITAGTIISGVTSTTVCTTSYPTTCSSAAVTITPLTSPFVAATNEVTYQIDEAVLSGSNITGASGTPAGLGSTTDFSTPTPPSSWIGSYVSGTFNGHALPAGCTITGITGSTRSLTNVTTTSGNTSLSCASGNFTSADIGSFITGTNIPANTYIWSVSSSTNVSLSQNATGSSTTGTAQFVQYYTLSSTTGCFPYSNTAVASIYVPTLTLQRDVYCNNLTLDPSNGVFALRENGYRIFVAGTLIVGYGCTIHNNGYPGKGNTAGNGAASGSIGGGTNGGAGITTGTSATGTAGTNGGTNSIATLSSGSVFSGGWGGHNSAGTALGALGGTISNALASGFPATAVNITTLQNPAGTIYTGGAGGGGGGGSSVTGGYSGGGGGGGGVCFVAARVLINYGAIQANGGRGGNAKLGTSTTCAGGGGGGGGAVVLIFGASGSTPGAITALSGASGGGYGTISSYRTGGYGAYLQYFTMYGQTGSIVIPANPGTQGTSNGGGPAGPGLQGMIWALAI